MGSVVILNEIDDAVDFLSRKTVEAVSIYTTHLSVDTFLTEKHGVSSTCISTLFSTDEIEAIKKQTDADALELIESLDASVGRHINERIDLRLRYFWALYSQYAPGHLFILAFFTETLKRICRNVTTEKLILYNKRMDFYMNGTTDLAVLCSRLSKSLGFALDVVATPEKNLSINPKKNRVDRRTPISFRSWIGRFRKTVVKNIRNGFAKTGMTLERDCILLYAPMYSLSFLKGTKQNWDFLTMSERQEDTVSSDLSEDIIEAFIRFEKRFSVKKTLVHYLYKDIRSDFSIHFPTYLSTLNRVIKADNRKRISAGVWGLPPVRGAKAIVFEYLMSTGRPVFGAQHGNRYGEARVKRHLNSDFSRCHYFFSYGFTHEDLDRVFPDVDISCQILPAGAPVEKYDSAREVVDILFPLQFTMSILRGGMTRIYPEVIHERQMRILSHFNGLKNRRVVVKPFRYYDEKLCAPLVGFKKRLNNLELVDHLNLQDYLGKYRPRAVVIEYPSTALMECLPLDAELFVMNDPLHPFEANAYEKLIQRVHFSESVDDLLRRLDDFLDNRLEPRRNDKYFRHYVYKENRERYILENIKKIVDDK